MSYKVYNLQLAWYAENFRSLASGFRGVTETIQDNLVIAGLGGKNPHNDSIRPETLARMTPPKIKECSCK